MVISHCYIYIIIYVSLPEGNNQQIEIYHELSSNHGKKCDNMEVETGIHSVCSVSGYSFESLVVKLAKQRHVYIVISYQLSSFTTGGGRRFQRGYLKNPSSNGSHQQKSLAGYATRLSCYHHPDSLHTISRHPNIISSWSIISPLQFCVVDNFSPESIIKPIIAPIHHPTIRVGILYPIISPF